MCHDWQGKIKKPGWVKGTKKGYTKFNSGNISITTIELEAQKLCNIHERDNSK